MGFLASAIIIAMVIIIRSVILNIIVHHGYYHKHYYHNVFAVIINIIIAIIIICRGFQVHSLRGLRTLLQLSQWTRPRAPHDIQGLILHFQTLFDV